MDYGTTMIKTRQPMTKGSKKSPQQSEMLTPMRNIQLTMGYWLYTIWVYIVGYQTVGEFVSPGFSDIVYYRWPIWQWQMADKDAVAPSLCGVVLNSWSNRWHRRFLCFLTVLSFSLQPVLHSSSTKMATKHIHAVSLPSLILTNCRCLYYHFSFMP